MDHFLSFYLPNNLKNQNFEKIQKIPGDIIMSNMCTTPFQPPDNQENHNFKTEKNIWRYYNFTHLHDKWTATNRIFCHAGPFFALLPPYGPRKSKFQKNEVHTPEDIISLQMCTINDSHMMYGC